MEKVGYFLYCCINLKKVLAEKTRESEPLEPPESVSLVPLDTSTIFSNCNLRMSKEAVEKELDHHRKLFESIRIKAGRSGVKRCTVRKKGKKEAISVTITEGRDGMKGEDFCGVLQLAEDLSSRVYKRSPYTKELIKRRITENLLSKNPINGKELQSLLTKELKGHILQ